MGVVKKTYVDAETRVLRPHEVSRVDDGFRRKGVGGYEDDFHDASEPLGRGVLCRAPSPICGTQHRDTRVWPPPRLVVLSLLLPGLLLHHPIPNQAVHRLGARHAGVAVQHHHHVPSGTKLSGHCGVDDAHVVAEAGSCSALSGAAGFAADGVELSDLGGEVTVVEGGGEGSEVRRGVPMAGDEEEGGWLGLRCCH